MPTINERDIVFVTADNAEEVLKYFQENLQFKRRFSALTMTERENRKNEAEDILAVHPGKKKYPRKWRSHLSYFYEQDLSYYHEIKGEFDEAIAVLENFPRNKYAPEIYVQLISLYERQERYEDAKRTYKRVPKYRVGICLRKLPFEQFLVCGCGTEQKRFVEGFDEMAQLLNQPEPKSQIQLTFLARLREEDIQLCHRSRVVKPQISAELHACLLHKLGEYLKDPMRKPHALLYSGVPDVTL